jgi:hypothetical protein
LATDSKKYVTNATASSIAFYAMAFLNNQGYSPTIIKKMREKFSLENLDKNYFTIEDLVICFSNQSAYFLNLYTYMNENDRFKNFAETLEKEKRFKERFQRYKDTAHLMNLYHRKIFHNHLTCEQIRKDYNEENGYYKNTGVFSIDTKKDQKYYVLPEDYLIKIGMRQCNSCYNLDVSIPIEDLLIFK